MLGKPANMGDSEHFLSTETGKSVEIRVRGFVRGASPGLALSTVLCTGTSNEHHAQHLHKVRWINRPPYDKLKLGSELK